MAAARAGRAKTPSITFGVEDIQQVRQAPIERGVAMGEIRSPAPGHLLCGGHDPEGNSFSVEARER